MITDSNLKLATMKNTFKQRLSELEDYHLQLLRRPNEPRTPGNGIFLRYKHPILTAGHTPLFWRYDMDERSNPFLMERFGINGVFNAVIKIAPIQGVQRSRQSRGMQDHTR